MKMTGCVFLSGSVGLVCPVHSDFLLKRKEVSVSCRASPFFLFLIRTYGLMNATAIQSLHGSLSCTRIIIFDKSIIQTLALKMLPQWFRGVILREKTFHCSFKRAKLNGVGRVGKKKKNSHDLRFYQELFWRSERAHLSQISVLAPPPWPWHQVPQHRELFYWVLVQPDEQILQLQLATSCYQTWAR